MERVHRIVEVNSSSIQVWENLFSPLTPSRRRYARSISRGGQLCQLLCPDSPVAIMRHDVTKPDSGILPKLMIALNGLATRQERDRWPKFPEEPRQIGTRTRSKMFNRSDRSHTDAIPYPNTRFPNIHRRIPRIANCTVYETVVSRSLIFRVNRLLLFRNCFTLFYIQLCNFTVGSLLRRSALFLRSLFSEWNFSHTSSVCSLCVHLSFELLKLFLECSYIYSFSSLFLTVLKS